MTAAEKLRMEIAQEIPFSKDEFISKISRLIKAYGYASFICDKHIRETDVSPNDNTIRMAHEQVAIDLLVLRVSRYHINITVMVLDI